MRGSSVLMPLRSAAVAWLYSWRSLHNPGMEPQIRYVRSADGTRIATATVGSGPPVVIVPTTVLFSIEGTWSIPLHRAALERIAASHTVVSFDPRGQGLSDRQVSDLSLHARVADIQAVFAGLRIESAFVVGRGLQVPATIAFAARHPDYVQRLVLLGGAPRGQDYLVDEKRRAVLELVDIDWELFCNALALVDFDWTEEGRQYGLMFARATTAADMQLCVSASGEHDASDLLAAIRCPTLLIYPSEEKALTWFNTETLRAMASLVPNARVLRVGASTASILGYGSLPSDVLEGLLQFLAEGATATAPEAGEGTAVVFFADIVDSTALTERMGDAAFRAKARALDVELRRIISEAGGTTIDAKTLGDGVLATFRSASQAIDAALRCSIAGVDGGLPLHLGLHAGDVIREANNVFGGAVNIASRISALSAPGEVLVSDVVRGLARTSAGVTFEDRGEYELRGISDVQRVYAVRKLGP